MSPLNRPNPIFALPGFQWASHPAHAAYQGLFAAARLGLLHAVGPVRGFLVRNALDHAAAGRRYVVNCRNDHKPSVFSAGCALPVSGPIRSRTCFRRGLVAFHPMDKAGKPDRGTVRCDLPPTTRCPAFHPLRKGFWLCVLKCRWAYLLQTRNSLILARQSMCCGFVNI
jgi:hypothetical protein